MGRAADDRHEPGWLHDDRIGWRLFAAAFTGTFACLFLTLGLWIGALVTVPPTAWLVIDWWRVRNRMRLAEHHALPPGSRDWGETRADHAPFPGWQPCL